MFTGYKYELWDGKRVVGYHHSMFALDGGWLVLPEVPTFKQLYSRKTKDVKAPIIRRLVSTNKIDYHYRVVIDVRKKSKRQIEIIKRGQR